MDWPLTIAPHQQSEEIVKNMFHHNIEDLQMYNFQEAQSENLPTVSI